MVLKLLEKPAMFDLLCGPYNTCFYLSGRLHV